MTNITLKSSNSDCLASLSGTPNISVYQQRDLRWLSFGDDIVQSVIDTSNPHKPVLPYLQAMAAMLAFSQRNRPVLNLGFGGGALVRFILRYLPKHR